MHRIIIASFAIVIALGWIGRMDEDVLVARSFKERLQFGVDLLHSLVTEGHLGIYEAERVRDFNADEPVRQVARSVGLLTSLRDGFEFRCTATVIAPDLILTNHHCIYENGTLPQSSMFRLDVVDGDFGLAFPVTLPPVEADAALDYAILKITPGRHAIPATPLTAVMLRDPTPGESLVLLHHPQSLPLLATRAHCRADRSTPKAGLMRHTCRTAGGSSGAPLFAARDHAVIGLHRGRIGATGQSLGRATSASALLTVSPVLRQLAAAAVK